MHWICAVSEVHIPIDGKLSHVSVDLNGKLQCIENEGRKIGTNKLGNLPAVGP